MEIILQQVFIHLCFLSSLGFSYNASALPQVPPSSVRPDWLAAHPPGSLTHLDTEQEAQVITTGTAGNHNLDDFTRKRPPTHTT